MSKALLDNLTFAFQLRPALVPDILSSLLQHILMTMQCDGSTFSRLPLEAFGLLLTGCTRIGVEEELPCLLQPGGSNLFPHFLVGNPLPPSGR